jgi:5'-3' exonuclease
LRRFSSAFARQQLESQQAGDYFDSNAITPGTEFLEKVHDHLRYFIRTKIHSDSDWQKIQVVLVGPEVPGEGEHKIMEYIRRARLQPNYDPNTKYAFLTCGEVDCWAWGVRWLALQSCVYVWCNQQHQALFVWVGR